ncbi:MAG: hydroxymethylbilane synthase, partial [Candidatus Hydrothermae bacterium]|nr:hydroxymethylbilane synthase [Candidatus Hydrothermae bacterium]
GSTLSRIQAHKVRQRLQEAGLASGIRWITTHGDRDRTASFTGVGMFVKEIQQALLREEIDLAVHSAKDLPTAPVEDLTLVAVLQRDTPWDLLIHRTPMHRIGTSSARRKALLRGLFPEAEIHPLRGNVDTRLRKLAAGETDAVVLSAAGLERLGLWRPGQTHVEGFAVQVLTPPSFVPAPAQGVIAVEMRADHPLRSQVRQVLNDALTEQAILLERHLLSRAGAGCHAPFGCYVHPRDGHWEGFLFWVHNARTLQLHHTAPTIEHLRDTLEDHLDAFLRA